MNVIQPTYFPSSTVSCGIRRLLSLPGTTSDRREVYSSFAASFHLERFGKDIASEYMAHRRQQQACFFGFSNI